MPTIGPEASHSYQFSLFGMKISVFLEELCTPCPMSLWLDLNTSQIVTSVEDFDVL